MVTVDLVRLHYFSQQQNLQLFMLTDTYQCQKSKSKVLFHKKKKYNLHQLPRDHDSNSRAHCVRLFHGMSREDRPSVLAETCNNRVPTNKQKLFDIQAVYNPIIYSQTSSFS